MYFEYRIVKIEKGLFLIEYKTAPFGVWHEVKNKQFKTKPKAEAWARKNFEIAQVWHVEVVYVVLDASIQNIITIAQGIWTVNSKVI